MFKNLLNFEYKRSGVELLGFYLFYIIVTCLIGGILAGVYAMVVNADAETGRAIGFKMGRIASLVLCTGISVLLIYYKKLYKSALALLLFLFTILASLLSGGLFALVFSTILSSFDKMEA